MDAQFAALRDQVGTGYWLLVGLREYAAPPAFASGHEAFSGFLRPGKWNAADRHLVLFQEFIQLPPFGKVAQGKAAVNLRLVFALALRREERQEIALRVDRARVVLA